MKSLIMTAEEVRATLSGRKTMVRVPVKPQPVQTERGRWFPSIDPDDKYSRTGVWFVHADHLKEKYANHFTGPLGKIGDRVYVRESFADLRGMGICVSPGRPDDFAYYADINIGSDSDEIRKKYGVKYRPASRMPQWASRLTLEITNIRVERIQDISEEDAVAEGIITDAYYSENAGSEKLFPCPQCDGHQVHKALDYRLETIEVNCLECNSPKKRFGIIWDSRWSKRGLGYDTNAWVWVYTYKLI